ncbi:hypothetical protein DFJ74DRAFT_197408 [Hyaloraphidium curvatum]|nr:hypothetical protein DFJ74DRAFT_197408 [Hyaloraphidium curvatum]
MSDPISISHETTARAVLRLENDLVKVTEWQFPPGTTTGWHRHGMEFVVVPITAGTLQVLNKGADGVPVLSTFQLNPGVAYTRQVGVEHEVRRAADDGFDGDIKFVEVELKHHQG